MPPSINAREEIPAFFRHQFRLSLNSVSCLASFAVLLSAPLQARPQSTPPGTATNAVSFSREIAPVLVQKCISCHGPDKAKGGYRLHTFDQLMKGGESKETAIAPGRSSQSKLFQLITAKDPEDRMPQKDDPLPKSTIALFERWIAEGARFDGPDAKAPLATFLPQAPHPEPPAVYARPVPVTAIAFSPDGKELAVGGYHEITFWNAADGKLLRRLKDIARKTHALAFHPSGTLLAAAGGSPAQSGEIKLLDPVTGATVKDLARSSDAMLASVFSSDGSRLAAAGADNAIRIFGTASGKQELLIEQHADWILGLAWNSNGTQIASASRDKTARIFDSRTGDLESTYVGHGEPVFAIAFAPDEHRVCSAGRDRKIHLWEVKEGKKISETGAIEAEIVGLIVAGNQFFVCSADSKARQYALKDKKLEIVRTFTGHLDQVYALAYHASTEKLATGSFDGEVRVWDVTDGKTTACFTAAPGYRGPQFSGTSPGPAELRRQAPPGRK